MKKIIFILLSIVVWWACEDNAEPIVGPEGVVSEFTDPRDGRIYKCVTIGNQTWMAENLAYRLPQGSIDGCYTYREEFVDTARIQPTDEDYFDEVRAALNDGRIGTDPLLEMPMFTPAKLVEMYLEYGLSSSMFVGMIKDAVAFYPSMRETADFLAGLAGEMKSVAIAQAVQKAMEKAEEQTRGYMEKYGLLYTYDGALKALPEGWKLPTDEDWKQLEETLGMSEHELNLLDEWRGATAGILLHDAKTGFNVNYGGTRAYGTFAYDSPFMNKDMNAYYWSSSRMAQTDSTEVAIIRTVSRVHEGILRGTSNMTAAYSIRCIKE